MRINHVPEDGKKFITYDINGNVIGFNNQELSLDIEARERDYDVSVDICTDKTNALVCGAAAGMKYVAQIEIPARSYVETAGEDDSEGNPTIDLIPVPFNMDNCTLSLWEMED